MAAGINDWRYRHTLTNGTVALSALALPVTPDSRIRHVIVAILFSLLETRTFQFTFLNTNITSNASVTSGSTSSMGTSGGTTNSSVSGDSSSSQQTTVDQSRNVYDDMKKTLETMLTPQKGRFWLSASTGTLTVTDTHA
ncbi:hypothetical protein FH461_12380 [Salmonella enterica]|nr:hypothetical protein [Salmonella enterica]